MPDQNLSKRTDQILETFIRRNSPKKKNRLFIFLEAKSLLCIAGRKTRVRNSIVDPERDDCDPGALHAKLLDEFKLHLFRMNEDVVGEPILDSQCDPIDARV